MEAAPPAAPERKGWLTRLSAGLRKTGSSITGVFTGTKIDDALYEELEDALLMADTGVKATQHLLETLKRRIKDHRHFKKHQPRVREIVVSTALTDGYGKVLTDM